jgi:hypothetical protein
MPISDTLSYLFVPQNQIRLIDPYQVRIYKDDTVDADVFLSRVVNSLYTIFGNNIVINGFNLTQDDIIISNNDVIVNVPKGRLIQDSTLLTIDQVSTLLYPNLVNENPDGRLVVFIRYKYLKTLEPNKVSLVINYIPNNTKIPVKTFDENKDKTLLGIFKFAVSDNIITSVTLTDESFIEINLESGLKKFYVKGISPDHIGLREYLINTVLNSFTSINNDGSINEGTSSVIWDTINGGFGLVNDIDDPGAHKYYGTDDEGIKGWLDLPLQLLNIDESDRRNIWIFKDLGNIKYNKDIKGDLFDSLEVDNEKYNIELHGVTLTPDPSVPNPIDNNASFKLSETNLNEAHNFTIQDPKLIEFWTTDKNKLKSYGLELHEGSLQVTYNKGKYYRFSFYAQKGTGSEKLGLRFNSDIFNGALEIYYDINTKNIQRYDPTESIKDFGMRSVSLNNWVKCWITFRAAQDFTSNELLNIFIINSGIIISNDLNQYIPGTDSYFGNSLSRCNLFGLKLTVTDYYNNFNDGLVYYNTVTEEYELELINADSYFHKDYLVYINDKIIDADLYRIRKDDDDHGTLIISNEVYLDNKSEVIVKQLEVQIDLSHLTFTQLSDTPSTYAHAADKILKVNKFQNGLEFVNLEDMVKDFLAFLDKNQIFSGTNIFSGDVIFTGNVTMANFNEVPVTSSPITDQYIILNSGETHDGVNLIYSGIRVDRGTLPDAELRYNEFSNDWEVGHVGQNDYSTILTLDNITKFKEQLPINLNQDNSVIYDATSDNDLNKLIYLSDIHIGQTVFINIHNIDVNVYLPDLSSFIFGQVTIVVTKQSEYSFGKVIVNASVVSQQIIHKNTIVQIVTMIGSDWAIFNKNDIYWICNIFGGKGIQYRATDKEYGFTKIASESDIEFPGEATKFLSTPPNLLNFAFNRYAQGFLENITLNKISDKIYEYVGDGFQNAFNIDPGVSDDPTKYLVFVNGLVQSPNLNYIISNNRITFSEPVGVGLPVLIRSSVATNAGDNLEFALAIHTHQISQVLGLQQLISTIPDYNLTNAVTGSFPSQNLLLRVVSAQSGTFFVPDLFSGSNYRTEIWIKGGGGGGSGAFSWKYGNNYYMISGSGGGEGEFNRSIITVTPGQNLSYIVGAGGIGSDNSFVTNDTINIVSGNPGSSSSFAGLVTVNGGLGGYVSKTKVSPGSGGGVTEITISKYNIQGKPATNSDGIIKSDILDIIPSAGIGGGNSGSINNNVYGNGGNGAEITSFSPNFTANMSSGQIGGDGFLFIWCLGKVI